MGRSLNELHCHFAPLGIPVLIQAGDPCLTATVEAAYADWRLPQPAETPQIMLKLERGRSPCTDVSLDIRVTGSRLMLRGGGMFGEADAESGCGSCFFPSGGSDEADAALIEAIDTILLFLLARSGRTPIHAAGIVFGDTTLVLTGPSGSGKSTLALAAARRGLQLLSDDMVFVQTEPHPRLWGFPRPLHVWPEDAPAGPHAMRLRGGKRKAVVPLAAGMWSRSATDRIALILLRRGDALALDPLTRAETAARLPPLEPGFDLLAEQIAIATALLSRMGAWQLTLASDAESAIDFLLARLPVQQTPVSA